MFTSKRSTIQIVVPGLAALLAVAVAMGTLPEAGSHDVVLAPVEGWTPYSADHARAQKNAPDTQQPPTF